MITLLEAIQYAKQDIKDGYSLSYYVENGKIYTETEQGFIQFYPALNSFFE